MEARSQDPRPPTPHALRGPARPGLGPAVARAAAALGPAVARAAAALGLALARAAAALGLALARAAAALGPAVARAAAALGLALALAGTAGTAAAFEGGELTPPGACAEREEPLVRKPVDGTDALRRAAPPASGAPEASRAATGPLHQRFQPTPVAAGPPRPSVSRPAAGELPRPGPCEEPGSGCLGPLQPAPQASPPPAPPAPPDFGFGTGPAEPPGRCTGANCP